MALSRKDSPVVQGIACPFNHCLARAGEPCKSRSGKTVFTHQSRTLAYRMLTNKTELKALSPSPTKESTETEVMDKTLAASQKFTASRERAAATMGLSDKMDRVEAIVDQIQEIVETPRSQVTDMIADLDRGVPADEVERKYFPGDDPARTNETVETGLRSPAQRFNPGRHGKDRRGLTYGDYQKRFPPAAPGLSCETDESGKAEAKGPTPKRTVSKNSPLTVGQMIGIIIGLTILILFFVYALPIARSLAR